MPSVQGLQEMASKRWRRNPNSRQLLPRRECPLQSDSNAKLRRNYNLFSFHGLLAPFFTTKWPASFCRSPPPGSGSYHATTTPTPPLLTSFAPATSSPAYRLAFVIFFQDSSNTLKGHLLKLDESTICLDYYDGVYVSFNPFHALDIFDKTQPPKIVSFLKTTEAS